MLDPVDTFPTWITEEPTTDIEIATKDVSHAGTYDFIIEVSDSLTGLTNNAVVFELELLEITAVDLDSSTAIADQIYRVGDDKIELDVPQYSHTPSNADRKYKYELVSPTPDFVTLTGAGDETSKVKIETTDHAMTDEWTVKIKVTEEYSQIVNTFEFDLLVTCVHSL